MDDVLRDALFYLKWAELFTKNELEKVEELSDKWFVLSGIEGTYRYLFNHFRLLWEFGQNEINEIENEALRSFMDG